MVERIALTDKNMGLYACICIKCRQWNKALSVLKSLSKC